MQLACNGIFQRAENEMDFAFSYIENFLLEASRVKQNTQTLNDAQDVLCSMIKLLKCAQDMGDLKMNGNFFEVVVITKPSR